MILIYLYILICHYSVKMNILFYGNCQLYAILKTLNLSNNYNVFHVECWRNDIDQQYFTDVIKQCDVIVTQHINDNYRNLPYLSTNYVKQHKKSTCKLHRPKRKMRQKQYKDNTMV